MSTAAMIVPVVEFVMLELITGAISVVIIAVVIVVIECRCFILEIRKQNSGLLASLIPIYVMFGSGVF